MKIQRYSTLLFIMDEILSILAQKFKCILKGMSIVIYEKIAEKNLIEVKFLMFLLIVDMPLHVTSWRHVKFCVNIEFLDKKWDFEIASATSTYTTRAWHVFQNFLIALFNAV